MTPNDIAGLYPIELPTPFPVGPVNVVLHKGDALTLIDCGPHTDEAWAALERGLAQHAVAVSDIERVLLTHHHIDHAGQLARVLAVSDAETWAHPEVPSTSNQPSDEKGAEEAVWDGFLHGMMREFGVPDDIRDAAIGSWKSFRRFSAPYHIDHLFNDEGRAGPFTTYFAPGHSVTDTLLVNHAEGYSIVGDHILEAINPNPLIHRPKQAGGLRPKSLVTYQHSLRRSRALELGVCFPGHGAPFADHRAVIDRLCGTHERRNRRVLKLVPAAGMTPYALAKAMYPGMSPENLYLILSVAVGHMEVLEERGTLCVEYRGGVLHYVPAAHSAQEESA
ncbi:MAG: MBL fold metallo-hydrolase [Candidatus Hydrogenedentota bacterium]